MTDVYAIILAGGKGNRSKGKVPKQFIMVNKKTILEHTIEKFNNNPNIDNIIVVVNPENRRIDLEDKILNNYEKVGKIVEGGKTRRKSTYNGLKTIKDNHSLVLIHDAVRPFVSHETINRCIEGLKYYDAVYPAVTCADTLIKINDDFFVDDIPIRKYMMRGQTPQGFRTDIIKKAHFLALKDAKVDEEVTNDCGLINRYNLCDIKVIDGNRENIKITYPEDIILLEKISDNYQGDKEDEF